MPPEQTENSRKVKLENLKPNMVVANSVVNDAGVVLIAKDTMLNRTNFDKLLINNIKYIYIKENSDDKNSKNFIGGDKQSASLARVIVQELPDFKEFESTYEKTSEELKSTLLDISDGGEIELDQLYDLTEGVMHKLKYKSDVFNYLHYIKDKDQHTYTHSANVSLLANLFGKWINLDEQNLVLLTTAASLHDLGKTKIPDEILNKKTKLTDEEFAVMRTHTTLGYRIMEEQDIPKIIKLAALTHHEKMDGSGYPMGFKSDQIHDFAKIIEICDIYDAMTANRVYRGKLCPFEVIKSFEHQSYGILDTAYLRIFLQNVAYTYVGRWVRLNDGREGEVVFINPNYLSAPIVRVEDELIDLSRNKSVKILAVV